jgi:sterol desaturase/sphingolipid hydroxylase (fatty acid hydroxylase superfamily)
MLPIIKYSIPVCALLMLIEVVILHRADRRNADSADGTPPAPRPRGYSGGDTLASLTLAALGGIPGTLFKALSLGIAMAAWNHRLFSLGTGWAVWVLAVVVVDFNEYWNHRVSHRMRLLWANHVQHHSSTHMNVSTALRTPLTSFSGVIFFPWLAILGFQPWIIFAAFSVHSVYQFWIHTELIGKLPRWYEFVFTTPSHHRVHHGSNGQYIDKNFSLLFILWDRIFGTFQAESEPVTYGLVNDLNSNNVWKIFSHEYASLFRDVRAAAGLRAKLALLVMPPGWQPASDSRLRVQRPLL